MIVKFIYLFQIHDSLMSGPGFELTRQLCSEMSEGALEKIAEIEDSKAKRAIIKLANFLSH